jgi:hypothetical protein
MKIVRIEWPDSQDSIVFQMAARIAGRTYCMTHFGPKTRGISPREKAEIPEDEKEEVVRALRGFADYIERWKCD